MPINNSTPTDAHAWYRQFYVWLIIFLPACAVIASFATLYIAAKNPPELVIDDYSNIEAINARHAAQDSAATDMGLRALLTFGTTNASGTPVEVQLLASDIEALPGNIRLRIVHSTQSAQDASADLGGEAGTYAGQIRLPTGRYDIILEDHAGNWRLTGRASGQPASLELIPPRNPPAQ